MSGFTGQPDNNGFSYFDTNIGQGSSLYTLLTATEIVPGDAPSYQLCKTIFTYHPLGGKMTEAVVKLAMSQEREYAFAAGPEDRLKEQFLLARKALNADRYIRDTRTLAKVYGQAVVACGEKDKAPDSPIDFAKIAGADLYFNVLDPLNTSGGSNALNQDPNAPDFLKPQNVTSNGKTYHGSRTVVQLNGPPIYIEWTQSAFGFTGRSVYQRALFPLRTFLQTMITDDAVTKKAALLVAKMVQPGSIVNNLISAAMGQKRVSLKGGQTGQVLSIGLTESIETLNFTNLEGPAKFARDNVLKNIATAADMPAQMLNQDTMAEGFGEGSEDAKLIAKFIGRERDEMGVLYGWFDKITMYRAWTPEFYETVQATDPDYAGVPYETAFQSWVKGFSATWPNFLEEPDSEKRKGDKEWSEVLYGAVAALAPMAQDQTNKARVAVWVEQNLNARKGLFSVPLELDADAIEAYEPPETDLEEGDETKEPKVKAERG